MAVAAAREILAFWFDEVTPKQWFTKDAAFDETLRSRFGETVEAALEGRLADRAEAGDSCLAQILVLDQFARNIFRDSPKAFAGDPRALELSWRCVARGWIRDWDENRRTFALMPMMHSEEIAVQEASLPLFTMFSSAETVDYAVRHRDIVAKWGRFPHRNAILGRQSTAAEIAFLKTEGSSF